MDRTVDQEPKPCGETNFQGREESDIRCHKGCHPHHHTWTILNQKISMHIAGDGKSSSGCWKPAHGEGKTCLSQKEKPRENLGVLVMLNLLTHAAWCASFKSPASVLALEGTGQAMPFKKSSDPWKSPSPTSRDEDLLPPRFGGGQARSVGTFDSPKLPNITDCQEDVSPGPVSVRRFLTQQLHSKVHWSQSQYKRPSDSPRP